MICRTLRSWFDKCKLKLYTERENIENKADTIKFCTNIRVQSKNTTRKQIVLLHQFTENRDSSFFGSNRNQYS